MSETHPGRLLIERAAQEQRARLLTPDEQEQFLAYADHVYETGTQEEFSLWLRTNLAPIRRTRLSVQIIDTLHFYGLACKAEQEMTKRAQSLYGST